MRYESPRVYFLFYNYFLRAVMGEAKWKTSIEGDKNKLGTCIAEAYAHYLLENNYFAWLLEFKLEHKGAAIKTEYDESTVDGGREEWTDKMYFPHQIDDVEISAPTDDDQGFECISNKAANEDDDDDDDDDDGRNANNATGRRHQEAKEKRRKIQVEAGRKAGRARDSHKRKFDLMNEKLQELESIGRQGSAKEKASKKRRFMKDLKVYGSGRGGHASHDATNTSAKRFVVSFTARIKEDKDAGRQAKFEKVYKELVKSLESGNGNKDGGDKDDDDFEVDLDELYGASED